MNPLTKIGTIMSLKLWPPQQEAFEFTISRPNTALFCEPRTGKTYVTLKVLETIADEEFTGVLICLLTNLVSTWSDKITEHLKWLSITHDWDEFKKLPSPKLLLIHFDVLPKLINKMVKYKAINWMAIDEAHRISNRGSKWSRACARMSWVRRKLIMTGTPIDKLPTDLFGQFKFLDPTVFGTNWAEFQEEYMDMPPMKVIHAPRGSKEWQRRILQQRIMRGKAKFNQAKMPQFLERIQPLAIRLTKADVGIIEPEVHRVMIPVLGAQRRYYEAMRKTSVVHLDAGSRVLAPLVITNIMKQRQLASGFVYDDDGELHYVGDAKLRRLRILVEQLPKPIVIFVAFKPDGERIAKDMIEEGYSVAVVTGQTKKVNRPQIWRDHQRAQYDITIVQTKTGGAGVDLWKASYAIVHSMGHSFRDFDQLKSRMDVKGKSKAAQIYVLCGENTIDEDLFDLVVVKRFNSDQVLNQLKRRQLNDRRSR